jgi:hypothetical protein
VIRNHGRIVGLILERVADIAIEIEWAARSTGIKAIAIILPGNIVGGQQIADALLHRRRNDKTGLHSSFRREGRVDVDGLPKLTGAAFDLHGIGERIQVISDGSDAGLAGVGTIEPLGAVSIKVECSRHRIGIIDAGCRRRCGIAVTVAEEDLIGKAKP